MRPPLAEAPPELRRIEEEMPFQRRAWRVERIGWAVMALFVLAALLGATGRGGPLAQAEATTPDGALRIRYERIQRFNAPSTLHIEARRAPADGVLELRLDHDLLRHWRLEASVPAVAAAGAAEPEESLRLRFAAPPAGGGPAAAPVVALHVTPEAALRLLRPEIALGDGPAARLWVLIWP